LAAFAVFGCSDDAKTPAGPDAQPTASAPAAAKTQHGLTAPINDPAFNGTIQITRIYQKKGLLFADGVINGQTSTGQTVSNLKARNIPVSTDATAAATGDVTAQAAGCQILHLDLGPIFLDLLGLQLTTNEIVIDLTAVPGPGNLLGNLLCAVVGLLDQSPLNIGLINSILAQINNLLSQL
jgi:hypothetical protein